MSGSPTTYSAERVRQLFQDAGVSVETAAEAFGLDEQQIRDFMDRGAPRWVFPAVIAVALVNGTLTANEAARIAQTLTREQDTTG